MVSEELYKMKEDNLYDLLWRVHHNLWSRISIVAQNILDLLILDLSTKQGIRDVLDGSFSKFFGT